VSAIAGIDLSSVAVHVVAIDEDSGVYVSRLVADLECGPGDAFERARRVRSLFPPPSHWRDNFVAIGIEETFSNRVGTAVTLARVQGAVLACLPREMLVMPLPANYRKPHGWKALTVGKTNASKDEVRDWAIDQGMPPGLAQDFYDAFAIARAVRELLTSQTQRGAPA
jgi:Holliday junction resolvasome RuvABC endonuclease subunit